MNVANVQVATVVRDACMEAMDALNAAVVETATALTAEQQKELRLAIAKAMAGVLENVMNPLLESYPELDVDEDLWGEIAVARARMRLSRSAPR